MSTLTTSPATFEMAISEIKAAGFDFTPELGATTIVSATSTLIDKQTGVACPSALTTLSHTTTGVTQTVTGSFLLPNHSYSLRVTIVPSDGMNTTAETVINCIF